MRRTAITALLAAVTLALASCSGSSDAETEAKPSATPTADPGDAFMTSVIDAHLDSWADGMIRVPARDELTVFPPQWCDELDAEHTVEWILGQPDLYPVGESWGTEKSDAYQLVLLGTKAYCPKWTKQVRDELRESGEY